MATGVYAIEIPVSVVTSDVGAAYVIPADRYAVVKAQVQYGETFLINGVIVLRCIIATNVFVSTANNLPCSYTVPGNRVFEGVTIHTATSTVVTISGIAAGVTSVNTNPAPQRWLVGPGQTITIAGGAGGANHFIMGVEGANNQTGQEQTYRVPAGTTISGGRYCVELYRIPGSAT